MKINSLGIFLALAVAWSAGLPAESRAADPSAKRAFVFGNTPYFHRWSQNDQHEFTPANQEDLKRWSDMITINGYPDVADPEKLAATATAVLENYKKHQATVLSTRSFRRAAEQPMEYLIVVIFPLSDFIEVAFARFKLLDGKGCSLVYSHRIYVSEMLYGKESDPMSVWLSVHGDHIETTLMEWSSIPSPASLQLPEDESWSGKNRVYQHLDLTPAGT